MPRVAAETAGDHADGLQAGPAFLLEKIRRNRRLAVLAAFGAAVRRFVFHEDANPFAARTYVGEERFDRG